MKTAILLGATGLVGRHLLDRLLESSVYSKVHALVRRPLGRPHPKLEECVTDFSQLEWIPADEFFCAIGTTIRKAGSRDAFLRVDYQIPLQAAGFAYSAGARRCSIVSSVDANAASTNFYLRVKGDLERDLAALGFDTVDVMRPSFLKGTRNESRPGERIGIAVATALSPLLLGGLRRYRPIEADRVAAAMVAAAATRGSGTRVYHYDELISLAG